MKEKKLKMEEKVALFRKYRPHFDAYTQFALADLHLPYMVKLTADQSDHTYTDHSSINIGLENVDVSSEEDFLLMVDYLIGHEVQHIRSTPQNLGMGTKKRRGSYFGDRFSQTRKEKETISQGQ